jgi:hypothetical protein
VYIALGLRIHDYFRMPEERSLGHVIEYSRAVITSNGNLRRLDLKIVA